MSRKIVTEDGVSSTKIAFAIGGLMLLPLLGLGVLAFFHLDDIRRWQWDSVEHWMLLASAVFVMVSHALMLLLLCTKPKDSGTSIEDETR